MTVSPIILAKLSFSSEQLFQIIIVLLVSTFGQADLLPRAAAELSSPLILTAPLPVLTLASGSGARGWPGQSHPWKKETTKCANQREPCH